MREILFRGKRRDNGEWKNGCLFVSDDGKQYQIMTGRYNCKHLCGVDPETVGQYTRVRDEYLKPLFEGDICRAKNLLHNGKEELFTVEWYENGFYFVDDTGTPWHPHHLEDIENIGNIHDHPELLGGDNA